MTEPVVHESSVRIGREPGRRAERLAILAGLVVLVAVMKPWGPGPVVETAGRPQQPGVEPTRAFMYSDMPCAGKGWLLETDERWYGRGVRTWTMTDGVEATGPTDQRIRFVAVAERVRAVGYCPPRSDDRRPHIGVTIFRLQPILELVRTVPVTVPKVADASENILFRPADAVEPGSPGTSPSELTWLPGRYVMQIDGPDGYQRWLGFVVRNISAGLP